MELFLRSQDPDIWGVITDGDFVPTTKEGVVKDKSAWLIDDKAQILLNSKARLFLSCALTMEESERVDDVGVSPNSQSILIEFGFVS